MKNIAAAFVKAQKGFAPALKTNTNPAFRSKYVALDGCIEAVLDALNANGIALLQPTHDCETGVTVETLFLHESGETLSGGRLHVPASKQDPQGYGSALTYARRYSLMAACGIAPEDDDGNAASKPRQQPIAVKTIAPAREAAAMTPINEDQRRTVEETGDEMVAAFDDGREMDALRLWQGITDNDIKLHLWAYIQSESKLRAFLKAQKTVAA